MKKNFLELTAGALFASLMIAGVASAQSQSAPERSLVGAWRVSLTPRNCLTGDAIPAPGAPYQGIYTFHQGGTMSEWLTNTVVLPTLRGPGHGVWEKTAGWETYSYSIIFNRYDVLGAFTGTQRGRATLVLGVSGNDYTTTGTVTVFDVNGNPLGTNCSTVEATRFE
jgi:hypothetical protein